VDGHKVYRNDFYRPFPNRCVAIYLTSYARIYGGDSRYEAQLVVDRNASLADKCKYFEYQWVDFRPDISNYTPSGYFFAIGY
jgi:hypothetical protein